MADRKTRRKAEGSGDERRPEHGEQPQRESARGHDRRHGPGERADYGAVVPEELPLQREGQEQAEQGAHDEGLNHQRPPEDPEVHPLDGREKVPLLSCVAGG